MDVAFEVAELLLNSDAAQRIGLFCRPDCADTICAYGILKVTRLMHALRLHCRESSILDSVISLLSRSGSLHRLHFHRDPYSSRSECASKGMQTVSGRIEGCGCQGLRILIFINCYSGKEDDVQESLEEDASVIVLDSRCGRKRTMRRNSTSLYILGGTGMPRLSSC